jgi:hypothetical protein
VLFALLWSGVTRCDGVDREMWGCVTDVVGGYVLHLNSSL